MKDHFRSIDNWPLDPLIFINHETTDILDDDVIKWKHFSHYWVFVGRIQLSPVDSPHKGQWHGDVFFDLRLNKRLSTQSRRRWFETPLRLFWRHCNVPWPQFFYCMISWRETPLTRWDTSGVVSPRCKPGEIKYFVIKHFKPSETLAGTRIFRDK